MVITEIGFVISEIGIVITRIGHRDHAAIRLTAMMPSDRLLETPALADDDAIMLLLRRGRLHWVRRIVLRSRRGRPALPRIVPARRDPEHAAHGGDAMVGPVRLHELESLN